VHFEHHVTAALACFGAQATGHDDFAVGVQRFGDRVQAFLDGVVNEATGVDDDQVSAFKGFGSLVTLGAQLRQDQLGIGQRFGAAQTDKTHFGGGQAGGNGGYRVHFTHPHIVPAKTTAP
jgi:hypothetical protein